MRDNQIIEALQICIDDTKKCDGCPAATEHNGCAEVNDIKVIVGILTRQQAEIENLKAQMDFAVNRVYELLNEYDRSLWRDIDYIDLADLWVNLKDEGIFKEKPLKARIKKYFETAGEDDA